MVYCVAWGCQNQSRKGSGISFFRFPPEGDSRRNIWIHRCQRGEKGWTPKCTSRLCSAHFEKDAFARDPVEMAKMGYSNARISLKGTAVPTVFTNREFVENSVEMPIRRPRSAFQKRRNAEVLSEMVAVNLPVGITETSQTDGESYTEHEEASFEPPVSVSQPVTATKKTQTMTLKPKQRTRRIQTCILPTSVSVGVQCELLVAPPILSTTQVDAATSDEEEEEEEDSDVLCNADSDYEPESESEDSETCDSDTEMDDKAWELILILTYDNTEKDLAMAIVS
ncbi:THAP domain-containing protein 5-like [Gigantopelta aegis]|uniref:THAP domain-containing protein 5-like n=1 Tax=Gigantopelta aegis TaxID=1735272 RepID=UPI001B88ABC0|nr:THAP domain-containing protein 5-like [Gigantopelta aegis]